MIHIKLTAFSLKALIMGMHMLFFFSQDLEVENSNLLGV